MIDFKRHKKTIPNLIRTIFLVAFKSSYLIFYILNIDEKKEYVKQKITVYEI